MRQCWSELSRLQSLLIFVAHGSHPSSNSSTRCLFLAHKSSTAGFFLLDYRNLELAANVGLNAEIHSHPLLVSSFIQAICFRYKLLLVLLICSCKDFVCLYFLVSVI